MNRIISKLSPNKRFNAPFHSSTKKRKLVALNSDLHPRTREFYSQTLKALKESGLPFMVGGTYAVAAYTGIDRSTKDLDLFVRREDYDSIMELLSSLGCTTKLVFPHWLGKAFNGDDFIDVIFNSGNGIAVVDDLWFEHAPTCEVLGVPKIRICPPEEVIWSKSTIMERERYDGADISHLILAQGANLDWRRLINRFGDRDFKILLSHVTLFSYVYPKEYEEYKCIPEWVFDELLGKVEKERREHKEKKLESEHQKNPPLKDGERLCRGTMISREQYLVDISRWGFKDARLVSVGGPMSTEDIATWTAAIDNNRRR